VRKYLLLILSPLLLLSACGGGGSSSSSGSGGTTGGGGTTQTITPPGPPNVEKIYVDGGPPALTSAAVNTPYVTIQVCVPNTSTCQTIDHIEVDTGSVGLRIISSVLNITLPAVPSTGSPAGDPLAECLMFADGSSWGSVNTADVTMPISGEKAAAVNVQVIGAASAGSPTASIPGTNPAQPVCPGNAENTVPDFGANGIIGVGPFTNDCNISGDCSPGAQAANYYYCPTSTTCAQYSATLAQQLQNVVTLFGTDNNGTIIELPAVAAAGAAGPTGSLVFGINTETDNSLPASATELQADNQSGYIEATLNGVSFPQSYLDSGSNGIFFIDSSLTLCPGGSTTTGGFYCPASTITENATLTSPVSQDQLGATFTVANADDLFNSNPTFTAFSNLGGTIAIPAGDPNPPQSLDLGLPFFFGTNIYTGIENSETNSQPFFAY
jgi:hypothetical protein